MNKIDQDTLGQEQNPYAAPETNAPLDEAIPQPSSRSVIAELVAISSGLLSGGVTFLAAVKLISISNMQMSFGALTAISIVPSMLAVAFVALKALQIVGSN